MWTLAVQNSDELYLLNISTTRKCMTFTDIFPGLSRTSSFNFQDFSWPKWFPGHGIFKRKNPGLSRLPRGVGTLIFANTAIRLFDVLIIFPFQPSVCRQWVVYYRRKWANCCTAICSCRGNVLMTCIACIMTFNQKFTMIAWFHLELQCVISAWLHWTKAFIVYFMLATTPV